MKQLPAIHLICRSNDNKTIIIYENQKLQIFTETFLTFVERFCNHFGTTIDCSRELAVKHFNFYKSSPLYIASLNHLVMVPSASLKNKDSFLYNAHQIQSIDDLGGSTEVRFVDGTCFEMNVSYRTMISQIQRANEMRRYYQQAHPFLL